MNVSAACLRAVWLINAVLHLPQLLNSKAALLDLLHEEVDERCKSLAGRNAVLDPASMTRLHRARQTLAKVDSQQARHFLGKLAALDRARVESDRVRPVPCSAGSCAPSCSLTPCPPFAQLQECAQLKEALHKADAACRRVEFAMHTQKELATARGLSLRATEKVVGRALHKAEQAQTQLANLEMALLERGIAITPIKAAMASVDDGLSPSCSRPDSPLSCFNHSFTNHSPSEQPTIEWRDIPALTATASSLQTQLPAEKDLENVSLPSPEFTAQVQTLACKAATAARAGAPSAASVTAGDQVDQQRHPARAGPPTEAGAGAGAALSPASHMHSVFKQADFQEFYNPLGLPPKATSRAAPAAVSRMASWVADACHSTGAGADTGTGAEKPGAHDFKSSSETILIKAVSLETAPVEDPAVKKLQASERLLQRMNERLPPKLRRTTLHSRGTGLTSAGGSAGNAPKGSVPQRVELQARVAYQ